VKGSSIIESKQAKGKIFSIEKYTVHDGPGIRTMIFFCGCPLECWWCCNPEGHYLEKKIIWEKEKCIDCGECIDICPFGIIEKKNDRIIINDGKMCAECLKCIDTCPTNALNEICKEYTLEDVWGIIMQDSQFYNNSYGGITLSGGEFTQQIEFAYNLLVKTKENYFDTAVETCGQTPWKNLEMILDYCDTIFYDIKFVDSVKHKKYTGVSNEIILDNFKKLLKSRKHLIIRIPLIPGINFSEEEQLSIINYLKNLERKEDIVTRNFEIQLLPFHQLGKSKYESLNVEYKLKETKPAKKNRVENILKIYQDNGFNMVRIGG
jgi:pyruvate formate lyase activating enzyme